MGTSFQSDDGSGGGERLYDILFDGTRRPLPQMFSVAPTQEPGMPVPAVLRGNETKPGQLPDGFALRFVQDRADIDIIGPEYSFVRSIRVYDVRYASQRGAGENDECRRFASVYLGTYGPQADFAWRLSSPLALPEAHSGLEGWEDDCPVISNRSVLVDWRDYEGNYGFEQVNY